MAQDFERHFITGVGTIAQDIPDGTDFNSDDAIVGIHLANTTENMINASLFMTSGGGAGVGGDFNFAVTVVNSGGNKYAFDGGAAAPVLTLYKGFTYTFDQSDSSNANHPLAFKTAAGGSSYTTGVTSTGTPGQAGAKTTFVVASNAPDSLIYYCTVHGESMGNTINLSNAHYIIKNAPIPAGSSLQVLDGGAKMVVQNGDRLFVQSDTTTSLDAWVSVVDAIST